MADRAHARKTVVVPGGSHVTLISHAHEVAALIAEVVRNIGSEDTIREVRKRVEALTERFPLYAWLR